MLFIVCLTFLHTCILCAKIKKGVPMERGKSPESSQNVGEKHTVSIFIRCTVVAFAILWIFLSIPVLVIVLFAVVMAWLVYRLNACCSFLIAGCPEFLSTTELYWLHSCKGTPSVIQCLIHLESRTTVSAVRDVLKDRISNASGSAASLRLRKRLVKTCMFSAWSLDNDFSLENHVTELSGKFKCESDVESHIALMANKDLEQERPLWNIQVLQSGWEDRTYLLVRLHPSFGNGNDFIELISRPLSADVQCRKSPSEESQSHPLLSIISGVLFGPLLIAYFKLSSRSNSPSVFPGVSPSSRHSIAWSRPINYQKILESRAVANCNISDFFLCAAAGTVQRIKPGAGMHYVTKTFMANLLYSFQRCSHACVLNCTPGVPLADQFATVPVQLPLHSEGIIPRLWDTLRTTRTLQQYCAKPISSGVLQIMALLIPSKVSFSWLSRTLGSGQCLVSCFSASHTAVSLTGITVSSIIRWFPPDRGSYLSFTLQTYNNAIRVGLMVDTALNTTANNLAENFATELDTLISFLAHRRVLRKHRHKNNDEFEDIDEFDDYLDAENDDDVTFNDEICRPCWYQRSSDVTKDERNQPQTSQQQHSVEIVQLDEPSSPSGVGVNMDSSRVEQLFTKAHRDERGENESGQRSQSQGTLPVRVIGDDVPASVISVEEVQDEKSSTMLGDRRPPSTPRRGSHGMTVITSVAVNIYDSQGSLDFSPCVERRSSIPADV